MSHGFGIFFVAILATEKHFRLGYSDITLDWCRGIIDVGS